ncbi:MAG: hypothetical protein ACYC5J_06965 [Chloroflexota bacterium]
MAATATRKLALSARSWAIFGDLVALGMIAATSALLVAFFLYRELSVVGHLGMPLDDAWIHFRVAENLATGYGFSYNPGEPTSASTSPAWTLLVAFAYRATGQFVVSAIALGVLCYLATNAATYYLALRIKPDRWLALAAGLFTAVTGRWVWASLSGMETTLFTALAVCGLLLYSGGLEGRRPTAILGSALLALSGLVRPEGFLLLGMAIAATALPLLLHLRTRLRRMSPRDLALALAGSRASVPVAMLALALLLRLAYTLGTGGGLAGNTFLAQSLPQGDSPYTGPRLIPDLWYLRSAVRSLRTDDFLLGLLIPLGMIQWIRIAAADRQLRGLTLLGMGWFVGLLLFNSMVAPNLRHHERYLMPLIPFSVLFGVFGIDFLVEQTVGELARLRIPRIKQLATATTLFALVVAVCLADALIDARRWATQYAGDVRSIEAINVRLGEWLRDHTPADSYVAMNDIGAIAFISRRRVLDTVGIAEPAILPYLVEDGREGAFRYLEEKRPDYLVIWPEWYPEMAARSDIFNPVYSAQMKDPLATIREPMLGGREMVVYEARWP